MNKLESSMSILSADKEYPKWIVSCRKHGRREVLIQFKSGIMIEQSNPGEKFRVIKARGNAIVGMEYAIEEVFWFTADEIERVNFLKNIKILTGLKIEEFIETLMDLNLKDWIIFNLDLLGSK